MEKANTDTNSYCRFRLWISLLEVFFKGRNVNTVNTKFKLHVSRFGKVGYFSQQRFRYFGCDRPFWLLTDTNNLT